MSIDNVVGTRSPNFHPLCTCSYSLGYLLLAGVCLIRWGTPDPWSRLDLFSCGYLLLRTWVQYIRSPRAGEYFAAAKSGRNGGRPTPIPGVSSG